MILLALFQLIFLTYFLIVRKDQRKKQLLSALFIGCWLFLLTLFVYTRLFHGSLEKISLESSWTEFFLLSQTVCLLIYFCKRLIIEKQPNFLIVKKRKNKTTVWTKLLLGLYIFTFFFSVLLQASSAWLIRTFGAVNIDQLLYNMTTSLNGTSSQQIYSFIDDPLLAALFYTSIFSWLLFFLLTRVCYWYLPFRADKIYATTLPLRFLRFGVLPFCLVIVASSLALSLNEVGFSEVKAYFQESELIAKEYIDPNEAQITFPEEKRNLIYIFAESLEGTYASKELGGAQENNLIQELTDLAEEGINFSNTEKIGGALPFPGSDYTVAGIVAQTSGMPLKSPKQFDEDKNEFGSDEKYLQGDAKFLPGLTTLGDLLAEEGYNQTFVMGSDATFGGRRSYLTGHGNYSLVDFPAAKQDDLLPEDYHVWWGFEDEKLFTFAKEQATILADQSQPFNLTLLTADTHFEDGYADENTPDLYGDQYANVIAHSSAQIAEFIRWCQQQPFYENTTIILAGDHLSMDQDFFAETPEDYDRTIFNLFLNAPLEPVDASNRLFASADLFPTTLASLGVSIQGERLGIGTNLFSSRKTLVEQYTPEQYYLNMNQSSEFYVKNILQDNYADQKKTIEPTSSSENEQDTSYTEESSNEILIPEIVDEEDYLETQ